MALKLLHTADLHLGMTFRSRNYPEDVRQQLVEARFESLEKLVDLAKEERCRLIIVAGDLFHRSNVAAEQISRAVDILKRFDGVAAILPGNHDYYEPYSSLWGMLKDIAFEELVLLTEQKPYSLVDYGIEATLYPAPCDSKHSSDNRLAWIKDSPEKPEKQLRIGVGHGTVRGISPDFEDQYYPMDEAELAAAGMDHWCLGHTHIRFPDLDETDRQLFLFSGTPEPDGFDCRHSGSAWVTELDPRHNNLSRSVETGCYRFHEVQQQVQRSEDLERLDIVPKENGQRSLVKLKLAGTLPESDYKARSSIYRQIESGLLYLETDDSELSMEITMGIINDKYPENSFPHSLLARLSETDDREALQVAYRLIEEVRK